MCGQGSRAEKKRKRKNILFLLFLSLFFSRVIFFPASESGYFGRGEKSKCEKGLDRPTYNRTKFCQILPGIYEYFAVLKVTPAQTQYSKEEEHTCLFRPRFPSEIGGEGATLRKFIATR